uniref:hypothetical protein n=1 Tax=Prevotella pectinovora TaxID=1602169 RepID=UPI00307BE734
KFGLCDILKEGVNFDTPSFFVGFPEYRFIPFCIKIEDKTKAFLLTSAPSRAKTHNDINPS